MNAQELQTIVNELSVIAQATAAAFAPGQAGTIALATAVAQSGATILDIITRNNDDVDPATLEIQLDALRTAVMAHADQTIGSLGDDTPEA